MEVRINTELFVFRDRFKNFTQVESGHVPAFICDADPPIIFDPGVSAFGPLYYRKLSPVLSGKKQPLLMLLTHSHFDHCGAAPYLLRKFPHAQIAASARAAEVLQKESAIQLIRRFNAEYEEKMARELTGEDTSFSGISIDLQLKEGDRIEWAEGKFFEVFSTPGHTRDCLSYFFPDSGVLVAGEAAGVPEEDFIHSVFLANYEDYVNSIEKLRTIEAEALCIAHVGILAGKAKIARYLNASREAAATYRAKIECCLDTFSGDQNRVVNAIAAEEYDTKKHHIINRAPFITNLQAKINAVCKLAEK
jgi:glyoxylase-like metal-dependent hydrolase (beta-lactamase superfamily II)